MPGELQVLGRAIKQAQSRQHRELDTRLASAGTTLAQWDALRAIARTPGATARALAAETFQSEQAFGTLANRMVARRLIERRPGRGRSQEHHLTPLGRKTLEAGHRIADEVLTGIFAPLSREEGEVLLGLLRRINGEDDGGEDDGVDG